MSQIRDILSYPIPKEVAKSVYEIEYDRLWKLGMRVLLFDYDNTLAPWRSNKINDKTLDLFEKLLEMGFRICIVTNAQEKRAINISDRFEDRIPVFGNMRKPGIKKLEMVLKSLKALPEETLFIGDLFLTDTIAGNRLKMYTIMVAPYSFDVQSYLNKTAKFFTRFFYRVYFYTIGWFFRMSVLVTPHETKESVFDIEYMKFKNAGFEAIIFDLDNTLAVWKAKFLSDNIKKLLLTLVEDEGFKVFILSNTRHTDRLSNIKTSLENKVIIAGKMKKPWRFKVERILSKHKVNKSRTLFIGDQLFTDVFTGNILKTYTIKVKPLDGEHEFSGTKVLRKFERFILKFLKKRNELKV